MSGPVEVTKVMEFAQGWGNPFSPPEGVTDDDDGGFAPVTGQGRRRGTGARDLREQRTALAGGAPGPDGHLLGRTLRRGAADGHVTPPTP